MGYDYDARKSYNRQKKVITGISELRKPMLVTVPSIDLEW